MSETLNTDAIKAQIVEKVKQIAQQKQAKKDMSASYTETINVLQEEMDALLELLDQTQRAELEDEGTSLVKDSD